MLEVFTRIDIDASAETVWAVLTDFPRFAEWNPTLLAIEGAAEPGARWLVTANRPGWGRRPLVVRAEAGRALHWAERRLLPGLLDAEHVIELERRDATGVRVIHRTFFSGLLLPLLARRLHPETLAGQEEMNQALKARVEGITAGR